MPPPAQRPGRPDPLIGSVVAGRYRIEARIASGGMGTVYRAEQLGLERKVALKLLHAAALEGTEDSQSESDFHVLEKRFSREAAILAKLAHPNIVTIFDYGSVDEKADDVSRPKFYMAMELLGGETLQDRIAKSKKIPFDELLPLARQIARGLREAHLQGIVHRDLKPANIMIVRDRDGDELVKLLDFGIGKVLEVEGAMATTDPRAELTQEGRFVGSPMYMAPEQIAHGHVDLRADVYSFGTVLYRALAGVHPFHKDNTALVMLAHLHEKAMPLHERVPDAPQWFTDLVDRCMCKQPAERPASMDEVLRVFGEHAPGVIPTSSMRAVAIEPLPPLESAPTIATGRVSDPLITPHTTSRPAMITGTQTSPIPVSARPSRAPWIVGAVLLAASVFTAVFLLARDKPQPIVATPQPTATGEASFTLMIESVPTAAEVREGDHLLGKTPLQLSMSQLTAPRTFVISAEGYSAYTLVQGPSQQAVRVVAPLVAAPAATPTPTPSPTAPTVKPLIKPVPIKPSATTPPPLDIIPKR
jgi:eukaryotic-like serine/threonine-protein kinase